MKDLKDVIDKVGTLIGYLRYFNTTYSIVPHELPGVIKEADEWIQQLEAELEAGKDKTLRGKLSELSFADLAFIINRFSDEATLDWKYGKQHKILYDRTHDEIQNRIERLEHQSPQE